MLTARRITLMAGMAAAAVLTAGALIVTTASADTAPETGAAAPAFTGVNTAGDTVSLSDFDGKTVILEWTNDGCPFVQKHYATPPANMQGLQSGTTEDGDTVWLSIISSAPGKQGHVTGAEADALTTSRGAVPTHVILDESGDIGRLYDAKTTPHMYIITPDGTLAYKGAIDSKPTAKVADIETADNYVTAALANLENGEPVATPSTKAYGCSVKYN